MSFQIIDTLKWLPKKHFNYKDLHIQRTWEAFQFFKIHQDLPRFELVEIYDQLEQQTLSANDIKVRMTFNTNGPLKHSFEILKTESIKTPVRLQIQDSLSLPTGLSSHTYKTTERKHWDLLDNFKSKEADDIVSINTDNNLVESSRFNLFFYDASQKICLTPSLESGCLSGVYRNYCLKEKLIFLPDLNKKVTLIEKEIPVSMGKKLAVYVGNSVRDTLSATFI